MIESLPSILYHQNLSSTFYHLSSINLLMSELDIATVSKRSVTGVFAFVSRSFLIQVINFARDFVLAILLLPTVYGVYYIVESFIAIISYFSDIGFAGALIQKKEAITDEELRTSFTVQLVLTLCIVGLVLFSAPHIATFFNFPKDGVLLLQAFVIAFFLSSLKTIPSVLLERNLEFGKFVIPQVVETIFYTVTVLVLALKGFGINSFTYAVLVRGAAGLITMYLIKPWKIGFAFSRPALSQLLRFGVPFQLNSLLALVKDNLLIIFLGKVLPFSELGYISFAQKWAFTPLRLVMDNIIRVTFSSFSRLQHDAKSLGIAFEKSLTAGTMLIFPSLIGLLIIMPYFMTLIPRYEKWEPSYLSLIYFAINAALAAVLVPLTNLLNATGRIKITLSFMILWTILTWVLTPVFLSNFGFSGFPLVTALINLSVIPVVFIAKQYIPFNAFRAIRTPLIASVAMGSVLYLMTQTLPENFMTVALLIAVGIGVYACTLLALDKEQILSDIQFIKNALVKKP
jgi:O-antigen/teichoic acid export membrane protein